jgi:16S rRNA (guanine527-N7)-methyltransferase
MESATLRELLAPFIAAAELDDGLVASVQVHLDLLVRWNQHMNLTALRSPEEMVSRHFGESLFAARHLFFRNSQAEVFDLGSGAGFPGLPMKYWAPQLRLTLIESHGKKATFLREVGRALHLTGFSVLNVRAESLSQRSSLVTLRAVEKFDKSLVAAARLVSPGSRLALLIGAAQQEQALSVLPAGRTTTVCLPSSGQRILLIWESSE